MPYKTPSALYQAIFSEQCKEDSEMLESILGKIEIVNKEEKVNE